MKIRTDELLSVFVLMAIGLAYALYVNVFGY